MKQLKYKTLHFKIKRYKSGEWIAQCKEISGIITGGMSETGMIKDAIRAGFNIDKLPKTLKIIIQ